MHSFLFSVLPFSVDDHCKNLFSSSLKIVNPEKGKKAKVF